MSTHCQSSKGGDKPGLTLTQLSTRPLRMYRESGFLMTSPSPLRSRQDSALPSPAERAKNAPRFENVLEVVRNVGRGPALPRVRQLDDSLDRLEDAMEQLLALVERNVEKALRSPRTLDVDDVEDLDCSKEATGSASAAGQTQRKTHSMVEHPRVRIASLMGSRR